MRKFLLCSASLAFLFGCSGASQYATKPNVPASWTRAAGSNSASVQTQWWQALQDPVLNQLVQKAIAQNLDVKIAATRVRAARAQLLSVEAGFLPDVTATNSVKRSKSSRKAARGGNAPVGTNNLFDNQIDATWEFNLFSIQPAIEGADATIKNQIENQNDVLLSLLGEVANNYVNLRRLQQSLILTDHTIAAYQTALELAAARRSAGLATEYDTATATATLETQKSQRPETVTQINAAVRRLEVLLGQNPGTLNAQLDDPAPVPVAPADLLLATPAAVIANRPDVRAAEQDLRARNAAGRVASAAYFPTISLPASFGWQAQKTKDSIGGGGSLWSLGAGVRVPIFDFGRIRADIDLADANAEQSFLQYQKSVQGALSDVETALSDYLAAVNRAPQLDAAVAANQTAVKIAEERYHAGLTNYLEVATSQQALYAAQQSALQNQGDMTTRWVTLYKAMGGGWQNGAASAPLPSTTAAPSDAGTVRAPTTNIQLPIGDTRTNAPRVTNTSQTVVIE